MILGTVEELCFRREEQDKITPICKTYVLELSIYSNIFSTPRVRFFFFNI